MRIALGIPHLPGRGRDENLRRLLQTVDGPNIGPVQVFSDVEPNRAWARRMWRWGLSTGADFFLTLQDDVECYPFLPAALDALLPELSPRGILGLAGHHPGLKTVRGPWARSRHWCVGWAYGMWMPTLEGLVALDASGQGGHLTEDSFVNTFAGRTGHDIWHTTPSLVDHLTDLPSTYGNDGRHPFRRSHVRWEGWASDLTDPRYWETPSVPLLDTPRAEWTGQLGGVEMQRSGGPLRGPIVAKET
jgi:hypothetical protein